MSQTAAPQAAPPPAAPAPAAAPATTSATAPADQGHVDTPALLNRWQLIGMTVAIVFGIVSALVQFLGWQADGRAAADTEQLVRVQKIRSSLLSADALATNAFLVGGLEDPQQRREYDARISEVLEGITAAADAQPADQAALIAVNQQVELYATYIANARSNNRQGYPVGAAYQSLASDQLRNSTLPVLEALVDANNDRARDAMNGQHPFWLLGLGVVALLGLWWLNRELANAFRRRINRGIAFAGAIIAVVTVITTAGAFIRDSSNDSLREDQFADAVASAQALTAANDAKANESLRLIKRGSGAANEEKWGEAAAVVTDNAPSRFLADWERYADQHRTIVERDESNKWDDAVKLATAGPAEDEDKTAFVAFNDNLSAHVADVSKEAVDELGSWRWLALVVGALTLLLGAAAAVSVERGIGVRRREFA
ncbi:hypothetical protein CFH99_17590 [Nocardioides aromaticivorans]|uniref:Secreted protein n=1 Tax=Nocardioides aromaticivorans TaxID=200618 RepID=A0ABX7PP10_9ACTN|nr:hypothetical protein [Nocardioides aromaticivorans]QSR27437.1 hypothetical protein CFH99_17590 [Nocardioides aromaticivorans]